MIIDEIKKLITDPQINKINIDSNKTPELINEIPKDDKINILKYAILGFSFGLGCCLCLFKNME